MENYVIIREIGRGAYGRAFKAISHRNNSHVVIKQVKLRGMDKRELSNTLNEVKVLRSLQHINIIRHFDSYEHDGSLCIVMEYAASGDLQGRITSMRVSRSHFAERQLSAWIKQLLSALSFLQSRCIIHRDLKPQNIFVSSAGDRLMIGDFGVCKVLQSKSDLASTITGTPYYLSPEIFQGRPYSTKSDIWSLGCIIYELVALRVPFDATDFRSLGILITRGGNPPFPSQYSRDLRDVFQECVRRDYRSRPDADQLLARAYFQTRDTKHLPTKPTRSLSPYRTASARTSSRPATVTSGVRTRSASPYGRAMSPQRCLRIPPTSPKPHSRILRLLQ